MGWLPSGRSGRVLNIVFFQHPSVGLESILQSDYPEVSINHQLVCYRMRRKIVCIDALEPVNMADDTINADAFVFVYSDRSNATAVCLEPVVTKVIDAKGTLMFPLFVVHIDKVDARHRKVPPTFGDALAIAYGGEFARMPVTAGDTAAERKAATRQLFQEILREVCDFRRIQKRIRRKRLAELDAVAKWSDASLGRYEFANLAILGLLSLLALRLLCAIVGR